MDKRAGSTYSGADERTAEKRTRGRPFKKKPLHDITRNEVVDDTRHFTDNRIENVVEEKILDSKNEIQTIEEISFINGENKLSIQLNKKQNNSYHIKIMLNGKTEIRPSTYNGARPALAYWELLRESLK